MKVVICDDCVRDLHNIECLLEKYVASVQDPGIEVGKFQDAAELYDRISEGERADIYILDMIMSEKSGIDIGSLLRSVGSDSVIVYITSSDDFALAAYGVHAARYLIKPVSEESFFEAMDAAWAHTKVRKRLLFRVRTKEGTVSVPYSGIEYIENYSRTLNVCLADGGSIRSIFIRKSFDEEIREIAEILQINAKTVSGRLATARDRMEKQYTRGDASAVIYQLSEKNLRRKGMLL